MSTSASSKIYSHVSQMISNVFQTQKSENTNQLKDNDSSIAKETIKDLLGQAIVLNSNEDDLNPEVLSLLLKTIFEAHPYLIEFVASRMKVEAATGNIVAAEKMIESIILQAISNKEPDADIMAADFFSHKIRAKSNNNAYSPNGKENPYALFWPNPTDKEHPRDLRIEMPFLKRIPLLDKNTAVASAGSCFAMEIAFALQKEGYNYIVTEPNKAVDGSYWFKGYESSPFATSSAAWGIHFNCPSFLQLVEKAFGYRRPAKILWTHTYGGMTRYCDPFREEIEFASLEAFESNYESHIAAAKDVFLKAEVLILTLGLNEVWYFKPDGSVFSRSPWRTAPSLVEHRALTIEENVNDLQKMLEILREHNPSIKVIVTLSPVPLHATFLGNRKHVVEANSHSKAILRVAAEEFVKKNRDVFYFPSYELVTTCLDNPWHPDQRHVSKEAVDKVMEMFKEMYCID